ncbi:hypothetical protein [Salinicoccus sp. CNSTN-B1]
MDDFGRKINKMLEDNQKRMEKMSQAFKPIQDRAAKAVQTLNEHQEILNKYLVNIYEAFEVLSSIDVDELNDRFHKQLSNNGWAVIVEIAFLDMYGIMEYEDEDEDAVDEQQLLKILYGVFEDTEADLEANLCRFLGESNTTFINKQFTLMRLGYRLNSIPVLIILIEKTIKKLADKDGEIVRVSEISGLLEAHIEKLANEEIDDEDKQKLIDTYTEAFKNNVKIIENTFGYYDQEKPDNHKVKSINEMGIINRNQVFHTAIDLDDANENHFYKLYFILIFLMEIRTLEEKIKQ